MPGRSRDESHLSNVDGQSSWKKAGKSQSTSFRSSGTQRKGNKGVLFDSRDQQVNRTSILYFFLFKSLKYMFSFIGKIDVKFEKSQLSFDLAANGTLNPQLVL